MVFIKPWCAATALVYQKSRTQAMVYQIRVGTQAMVYQGVWIWLAPTTRSLETWLINYFSVVFGRIAAFPIFGQQPCTRWFIKECAYGLPQGSTCVKYAQTLGNAQNSLISQLLQGCCPKMGNLRITANSPRKSDEIA